MISDYLSVHCNVLVWTFLRGEKCGVYSVDCKQLLCCLGNT